MSETTLATIYIVESDANSRSSLCALLARCNTVLHAYPNAEALLSQPLTTLRSCLVTALHLSGMSGLDLILHLQNHSMIVPTIVLATASDVPTAVRVMRAGAVDFLDKPIIERVLYRRIQQILAI